MPSAGSHGEGGALSERQRAILLTVVEEYIESAQPVASRAAALRSELDLSPASVRGLMAELAEQGLLCQAHVSAGRVPTDRAYRIYVDALLAGGSLLPTPAEPAYDWVEPEGGLSELMQGAADLLSRATGQVGFYAGCPAEDSVLERIRFVRLSSERVMALLVSHARVIQTRVIEEPDSDGRTLERVSEKLSRIVAGLTLADARARLARAIEADRVLSDELQRKVFVLGWQGLARSQPAELFVGDREGLLANPEFADVERLRALLAALEEKERMMSLLDKVLRARTTVAIGSELGDAGVRECALIAVPLGSSPGMGGLGVIGPIRMRYDRVISTLRHVSGRVTDHLC